MKINPSLSVLSRPNPLRGKRSLALAVCLLVPGVSALAQTQWIGGTGPNDYNNTANWSGGVIPSGTVNCTDDHGSNNIILIQPGDPVFQHGDTLAGNAANTSGAWLQTGSTNNTGGGNWLRMALGTGSYGSYVLSNGVVNVGGQTHIGEYGVGYLEVDGGTFNDTGDPFCLGDGDFGPSPVGYMVMNGGTVNTASECWIGEGNATQHGTGYLTMNGGTININFWWDIGRWGATGYLNMNGGTINKLGGGNCQFGAYNNGVASSATVNMIGGTININNDLQLGQGGNGTVGGTCLFNQSGGTIHVSGQYEVATDNIQAVTTNNLSSNAVLIVDSWLAVGRAGGIGTMNISGNASVTKTGANGGNITLSGDNGGTSLGTVNQNGGTLTNTATQTWIAENYNGFWNLNAGLDVLGVVHLSQNAGASGTFSLNGGDLFATEITDNGGASVFYFNGGTLHAGGNTVNLMHGINGAVYLQAAAKINTEGYNATISAALNDNGGGFGVTKLGAGTLTLAGANSYTGPTIVSNGVLIATTDNTAWGTYTIEDNAGFGVTVTTAGGQFSPSTVNLGNTTNTSLNFDLGAFGNPTAAPLYVNGNLAVNGTNIVNIADAFPQLGQFHLVQYNTESGSGTFTLGTLPSGVTATLVSVPGSPGYLDLDITAVGSDVWDGLAGGNWDIGLTTNWVNFATLLPVPYTDRDLVQFDDTATGTTVVNLVTNVTPNGILFNNTATNYTLVGPGRIIGTAKLVKSGTNTLAIYNTNGYTGATVLNSGTIVVTNLANGGLPSPIGASSANPTNLVLNGGTLSYQGPPVTINRGYNVQGNYGSGGGANVWTNVGSLDTEANVTISGTVTAANGSSFVKTGPATLTYIGSVTNQLSGGSDPGYQVAGGTLVFDGSAGHQVNHSQQEFWVGDTTNSGANIILTNTTLNVDSWFCLSRGNGNYGFTCYGNLYNSTLTCGNFSLGYWNGRPNLSSEYFTMTNSTVIDNGNFNVSESAGSVGVANIVGHSLLVCGNTGPMLMGLSAGATGSVLVANSSIITNNSYFSCGANGAGTLTLQDSALYVAKGDFNIADTAGSTGILYVTNSAQVVMPGGGGLFVGKSANAVGAVYQSANSVVNVSGATTFQLGQQNGAVGTWSLTGNSLLVCGPGGPMLMGTVAGGSGSLVVANSCIVTNNAWLSCGANGAGTLTLQDNALYVENSDFNLGDYGAAGTSGTLYLTNNAQVVMNGGGGVYVGKTAQSIGTVYQSGNSGVNVRSAGVFQLGQQAGSVGTWYQSSGTNYAGGWVSIGRGNTAGDTTPTGVLVVSGGLFDQTGTGNGLIVGEQGTGTLLITNSGMVLSESVNIGMTVGWNGGVGEVDLGGGTLIANFIQSGVANNNLTGSSSFNFNGGLLKAGANARLNFMTGLTTATILSGATIDTGANTVSIAQALLDGGMNGGLTKLGNGTLLLDGANTYLGSTFVSAGTLGGSGTIAGPLVINNGATLSPGDSALTNTIGTLTLNNNALTINSGSTTVMEVNKTTGFSDLVTGASTITYGGTLVLRNLSGALSAGDTFTLFTAGTYNGSFSSLVSRTPNQTVTWDLSQLAVNGTVKVATAVTTPAPITAAYSGGSLNLSWPANQVGWELQQQTNSLAVGLSTNWVVVAGSTATNQATLPVSSTVPSGFFRLVFPAQ